MGPPPSRTAVRPCRATGALYAAFDAVPSLGAGVHRAVRGNALRRFGGGLPVLRLAETAHTVSLDEAAGPAAPFRATARAGRGRSGSTMHAGPPTEIRDFRRAERGRLREDPNAASAPASPARPPGLDRRVKVIDAHPATSLFSHCARIWTAAGFNPLDEAATPSGAAQVRAVPATAGRPARRGSRCRGAVILGVDVGGTFADAVLVGGERVVTGKSPATPDDQSEGVMRAIEEALEGAGADAGDVERFVHGMTVGTNALLEGRVARTAPTEGFTDLEKPAAGPPGAVPAVRGEPARSFAWRFPSGRGRTASCGRSTRALCARPGRPRFRRRRGLPAVGLPAFRARATCGRTRARRRRPRRISLSHGFGTFREYERCATTVVDAALSPLLAGYLERLTERARRAGLASPEVMLSSGGTADAATAASHGSWTVLSGPAGGAVGAARSSGAGACVGLDMGGTSCDVSVSVDGRVAVGEAARSAVALALPMVEVHTVGAGGGSIAWRDAGGALRVGPGRRAQTPVPPPTAAAARSRR